MTGIIILSVVTAIIIFLCAIILSGKGNHLIASYNTAKVGIISLLALVFRDLLFISLFSFLPVYVIDMTIS